MTQVSKPISPKLNVLEGQALTDDELDAVSGGFYGLTQLASQQMTYMMNVADTVIKNIGETPSH